MCTQDAHNGQYSPPSNSYTFARLLYKNWLGWNSTDSFSCLKIYSSRRNGDSLCEVLEDSFGSPHWAPVCKTLPYLQLPSQCCCFSHICQESYWSSWSRWLASPSLTASTGAEHRQTAAHIWQEGTQASFPLLLPKVSCFRVLGPGAACSCSCSCHQLFWVTEWQAQSK